jgi:PAS domain S-box-containing protein
VNLRQFNSVLRQVFLLPVVALLVVAGALYMQIQSANATVNLIQDSDARISQATLISKLIVDEESGLRGYETTGDAQFLQPFTEAESHVQEEIQNLDAMAGANANMKHDLTDLRDEHQTWHDGFAVPVIAQVRGGGKTSDVALNLHGKVLMDAVRHDINDIIHKAEDNRTQRIVHWHQQVHMMLLVLLFLALGMGILIGLFTRNRLHTVSAAYRTSLEILGRRAEEIFQSEQQLRTTLDSIGDGVITCDAAGRIQMMNPVARELTGWSQSEANGQPLERIFHIVNETSRKTLETRLDRIVGMANHTVLVRKDGTELNIADSGAPIRDKNGEIIGIVLVFRDITMERKTQDALIANEKLAVAGRLAATIAHEIHNPLDSVSNLLYLMRNGATPEESRQFMGMAEQELARVTQISRAMLGLYRESKAPVVIDLKEMLQEILLLMERRFIELNVMVSTDMPQPVSVAAFPAELRQVFTNLIANAAEAASPGGQVKVSIKPQAAGTPLTAGVEATGQNMQAGATVTIADNGAGITAEVQSHLFQPFFTTKGERGTGLGLWVSRGIINKHGGTISLKSDTSQVAHGTVVSVFLATNPTINAGGD